MTPADLWLPILLAAVAVFLVSSVVHMALPHHKSDHEKLPDEDAVLDALRSHGVGPGSYMFPYCESMDAMKSEAFAAKVKRGPVGFAIVTENPSMGRALGIWFVYTVVVSVFVAYLASLVLAPGADNVFRVTSTAAFFAYALGSVSDSIWKYQAWAVTAKFVFDGLLYALATGAVFAWLWPAA